MFQLPQLASLNGSLPHERRHSDGHHAGDSERRSSGYGRVGSIGTEPGSSMRPPSGPSKTAKAERRRRKSESMAKKSVTKASELMYLVPHNKDEAKQYKSVLVFCDVKLKEGASRRRNSVDKGPDVAASAACCHVLDTLCDDTAHHPAQPCFMTPRRAALLHDAACKSDSETMTCVCCFSLLHALHGPGLVRCGRHSRRL